MQWDEGLVAALELVLGKRRTVRRVSTVTLIEVYDTYEHRLEQTTPFRSFRAMAGESLRTAMEELGLGYEVEDSEILTSNIFRMPPFPQVVDTLGVLKAAGFGLCIISNTDDDIIAGNVAQLGGHIDRVVTAEQARAYKPSTKIFECAHADLGVTKDDVVHICAWPHRDLVAARDLGFRSIWIDRVTGRRRSPDYVPGGRVLDTRGCWAVSGSGESFTGGQLLPSLRGPALGPLVSSTAGSPSRCGPR